MASFALGVLGFWCKLIRLAWPGWVILSCLAWLACLAAVILLTWRDCPTVVKSASSRFSRAIFEFRLAASAFGVAGLAGSGLSPNLAELPNCRQKCFQKALQGDF